MAVQGKLRGCGGVALLASGSVVLTPRESAAEDSACPRGAAPLPADATWIGRAAPPPLTLFSTIISHKIGEAHFFWQIGGLVLSPAIFDEECKLKGPPVSG